jgi:hypothetical protein
MDNNCHSIIVEIESALSKNEKFFYEEGVDLGYSNGILGLSLFYYYYYLYTKEEKYLEKLTNYLERSYQGIITDYSGSFIIGDIVEVTKILYFLKDQELMEDAINPYCEGFDLWIEEFLKLKIREKELDPICGITLAAGYYLERSQDIDITIHIDRILHIIEELVIENTEKKEIHFQYYFNKKISKELGKGHGITSVIFFLLRVYDQKLFQNRCKSLLLPALNFLINRKTDSGINLFPFEYHKDYKLNYSNLSYGDIGIAYTLYNAGLILGIKNYTDLGLEVMKNIADFKDSDTQIIRDANLIYGASGIYSVFRFFEIRSKDTFFKEASEYWFDKIIEFNTNDTPWAGYKTYMNGNLEDSQLSYSQGICGIGVTMLCKELDKTPDYLKFLNYNFI